MLLSTEIDTFSMEGECERLGIDNVNIIKIMTTYLYFPHLPDSHCMLSGDLTLLGNLLQAYCNYTFINIIKTKAKKNK